MKYTMLEQVKIRLKQFHIEETSNDDGSTSDTVVFDDKEDNPYIEQLIAQVKTEVTKARRYPNGYTEEQIEQDMLNYERVIVDLVVYDHSQAGEAFMSSYSENGISRNWRDRAKLFAGVLPVSNVL